MLGYLDALCAALLARNAIETFRLLGLPAASQLPREVRDEAVAIAKAGVDGHRAPVHALQLYYKLSHLVDESTELRDEDQDGSRARPGYVQFEIPFRRLKVS